MSLHPLLARFAPTRSEVWTFGVGSLVPFGLLTGARLALLFAADGAVGVADAAWVNVGELAFWAVWGWAWWAVYRLVARWVSQRAIAGPFHIFSAFWCLFAALDLAYWQTTGSRVDWEMLTYGLGDLSRVWPVVSSELTPTRWALLLAVLGACVAPMLRRGAKAGAPAATGGPVLAAPPAWRATAVWAVPLVATVHFETNGRPKPASAYKTLQANVYEILFWDALERRDERVILPTDDAAIAPVAVRPVEGARHPNVVLIFLESVTADATTAYNPALTTTPNLARMAAEGLRVDTLTSVVPHTSKSLVASICGDWPYLHSDVREARPGGLPGRCLPELLAEAGYRSAFFQPARADFEDRTALVHGMGYGRFLGRTLVEAPGFEETNYFGIDDRSMIEPGLAWSKEEPDRPFFATYLTLGSHHDYKLPASWPTHRWPGVKGRRGEYLASVNFVDTFLGDLVRAYRAADLLDDTVFVVLGDHGEAFGEHGRWQHDLVIWEEGLHVPGVIWGPGVLDRRGNVGGTWQQIDVLPTVLDLAGLEVVGGAVRGASLLDAPPEERVLFHSCWRAHRCLARRDGTDKVVDLFRDGGVRRYDLATDPKERRDRSGEYGADELAALRDDAREWRAEVLGLYAARDAAWRAAVQVPDASPAEATWGGRVSLLGCTPEVPDAVPGETVWIDCRWRAEEALDEAIRVTTTVRAGAVVGEGTWVPAGGELPVWEWSVGHAVSDTVRVLVPPDAPPGPATIELGWASYTGRALEGAPVTVPLTVRAPMPRTPGPGAAVAGAEP